jgi:2-oxoisovalerate dehydrogenase E1 component
MHLERKDEGRRLVASRRGPAVEVAPPGLGTEELLEIHLFMRLAREWDLRFEKLFRTGSVAKWYSAVGNEATTVAAASALEPDDALLSLHRDSGAILRYYVDGRQLFPDLLPRPAERPSPRSDARELLYRLACQMIGKRDGFSHGYERSYHYGYVDEAAGILHVGMISHLGAMIPVAAGMALGFKQQGKDRVALNFIGDGGTSTGDFHESLNMAAVLRVPLVLVIENNQYAFSTPLRQQCAVDSLAVRAKGYGIPGVKVDGNDAESVWQEVTAAVQRARDGEGPTLIEAVVGRMRGHSEGDDSIEQVPAEDLQRFLDSDPIERFEASLIDRSILSPSHRDEVRRRCAETVVQVVDEARGSPDPEPRPERRRVYAD